MFKDQKKAELNIYCFLYCPKNLKNMGDNNGPWLKPPNNNARPPKKEILQKNF